jgi:hypothetical protein
MLLGRSFVKPGKPAGVKGKIGRVGDPGAAGPPDPAIKQAAAAVARDSL